MKRLNIGLDFDDVIANSHLLKPVVAKKLFGVEINPDRFRREWVVPVGILTNDQYVEVGKEVFSGKYPMIPVPGVLEYVSRLIQDGHKLRIVSSRSVVQGTLEPAIKWISYHSIDLPLLGVGYRMSKADACKGLDLFVDDDSTKLEPLVGVVQHLVLFSWPQNSEEIPPKGTVRVWSWEEAYQHITQVALQEGL